MSVTPSPIGGFAAQFFDNNGVILSGGKIYTYAAGTTTPQASYTSATGVTPHANPIILDSAGRVPGGEIWLTDGLVYKFVIETATSILIGTYDNITGVNSNFVNYTVQEEVITATAGQTVFNLSTINYSPGTNSLTVYIDGVNQYVGDSYLETDSDTVTFTSGVHVGGEVKFTTAVQTTTGAVDASIVSYEPPFANSVATNVEAKLAQSVSVMDFGAVGDGVADDTAAIQAAIDQIKTQGGGSVVFPYGNYKVTSTVNIAGNFGYGGVQLIGNNSTITSTANAPAFLIDAYDSGGGSSAEGYRINAVVDGFYFNGPGVASLASVGIKIQLSAEVLVRNCGIRNFYKGLEGFGVLITRYEGLRIQDNYYGIYFNFSLTPVPFGCNDNHFIKCDIFDCTKAVFYSTGGGASTTFNYCEIEGNNLASTGITDGVAVIDLYLAGKITFNGCYFELNKGQYNIKYVGADSTGSLNFVGCQFLLDGSTGNGIFLDSTAGTPNSLTMIGCSVGFTATSDLHIGTGFSVSLINTQIGKPITGSVEKLATYRNGRYVSGGYTSDFAPMLLNGSANGTNIGLDVNGLLRFTDASGATRRGYAIHNGTDLVFLADTGGAIIGLNSGVARVQVGRLGTATVEPNADNTHDLGTGSFRWKQLFAGTATINTSDARAKQQVRDLSEAERATAVRCKSLIRAFKFNDAVEQKGDGARIHFGVIAQDVKAAFEAEGLDASEYGLFCYDEWDAQYKDVVDENMVPTGEQELVVAAGNRYGIRYEPLLAFMIAAL